MIWIIILIGFILLSLLLYFFNNLTKEANKFSTREREIVNRIKLIETVKDCDVILKEITLLFEETDPQFKGIKEELRKDFYYVKGLKKGLESKNH